MMTKNRQISRLAFRIDAQFSGKKTLNFTLAKIPTYTVLFPLALSFLRLVVYGKLCWDISDTFFESLEEGFNT